MTAPAPTAPRIPPDVLDDLRWQAEHPAAIVTMSKSTLRALLAAYATAAGERAA